MLWSQVSRMCYCLCPGEARATAQRAWTRANLRPGTKTLRPPGGRASPPDATCAVITGSRAPLASGPEFGETIYCHWFWGPGVARPAPPTPVGPGAAREYAEHVSGLRARSRPGPRCLPKAELPSKQVRSPKVRTQHSRSCRFPTWGEWARSPCPGPLPGPSQPCWGAEDTRGGGACLLAAPGPATCQGGAAETRVPGGTEANRAPPSHIPLSLWTPCPATHPRLCADPRGPACPS